MPVDTEQEDQVLRIEQQPALYFSADRAAKVIELRAPSQHLELIDRVLLTPEVFQAYVTGWPSGTAWKLLEAILSDHRIERLCLG